MSATLSTSMPAPCPPLCRPPCPPQCRPPQYRLDALWGLRDADRMEIQKYHGGTYLLYTDGLTGVCARDACAFKYTKTQVSYQTAFVCKWLSAIFCSLASQLPMDCIDPPTDIFLREPFIAIIWIVIIIISIIRCHGNICKKKQIITLGIVVFDEGNCGTCKYQRAAVFLCFCAFSGTGIPASAAVDPRRNYANAG